MLLICLVLGLCGSVLWYQAVTGVPAHSSTCAEAHDVIALLQQHGRLKPDAVIYELGCGWGGLILALAKAFPHARIYGVELSPLPYWVARWRTRRLRNVHLRRGNFYHTDISDADAVTCYLMIKPMPRLATWLDEKLRPGTPVVALTFWFRQREVAASLAGPGLRGAAALYRWPAR